MAYNAIPLGDQDISTLDEANETVLLASSSPHFGVGPRFQPLKLHLDNPRSVDLFMDHQHEKNNIEHEHSGDYEDGSHSTGGFGNAVQSVFSRTTQISYDVLEDDDYTQDSGVASPLGLGIHHQKQQQSPTRSPKSITRQLSRDKQFSVPRTINSQPIVRTASGRSTLRHPTPDLHTLQGAFMSNVEHLEATAEKLSMTSSIEDAIRQLHDEQKRSDSRRSSLLALQVDIPTHELTRQFSNPSSIIELNSTARSGGYSPSGFNMMSPLSTTTRGRSASKGSRFDARPEPELEGRPLDSFVNRSIPPTSPALSRSASVSKPDGQSPAQPAVPAISPVEELDQPLEIKGESGKLEKSASDNTIDQAQAAFSDFDGEHFAPRSREASVTRPVLAERRVSSGNRLSMARPLSYADPGTGQQMVYYPAPVPMMLNLPQKLSKLPSAATREKRRTQVLSSLPPAARKSAIWLPDVLENEDDISSDAIQQMEYVPQHQRRSMGGRRTTADLDHLPPQLRASTFFDQPSISEIVQVKGESAVATLDSILDASAYAPVSAFTDHVFAGRLGAEVYGQNNKRATKSKSQIFGAPPNVAKRATSYNLLGSRRNSSSNLLDPDTLEKRRATMSADLDSGRVSYLPRLDGEDDIAYLDKHLQASEGLEGDEVDQEASSDVEDDENEDEIYEGAPTTLLAELQLRKQQQKQRTRPITAAYPNGIHSTLLELDAVAQVEKKSRGQKRVNLAWEDEDQEPEANTVDEDVPLAMLFPHKSRPHQDRSRPMGLMERRDLEDNEPLSRRRERILGIPPPAPRASTMLEFRTASPEKDTLTQTLKDEDEAGAALPHTRPVSTDFSTELMSQFGPEAILEAKRDSESKRKDLTTSPPPEEEETLGQRRKRLQAEREAREKEVGAGVEAAVEQRPALKTRRSMADILQANPVGPGRTPYNVMKPGNGLQERQSTQRASTMLGYDIPGRAYAGGFHKGMYNDGSGGIIPQGPTMPYMNNFMPMYNQPNMMLGNQYAQQQMMNPYMAMGYNGNAMMGMGGYNMQANPMAASMLQMAQNGQPLNQGQVDMVERWRQSVMQ